MFTLQSALAPAAGGLQSAGGGITNQTLADLQADLVNASLAAFNPANFRNLIDGGDFTTNPWQRGTSFTGITNTVTYTADRWFGIGAASSSISISQQANVTVPGFAKALQFGRAAANADVNAINIGQIFETPDCYRLQSQTVTLSFWAAAGANFSGANLSVKVITGTGNNQTAANLVAGSWTNQANLIAAGQALTTAMVRYSFTAVIPAATTQVAVEFGYTPTGTAGANDWVQFAGIQFELSTAASAFEARDVAVELEIAQRYCFYQTEPAAGVVVGSGMNTTAAIQIFYMATPVTLRAAPTVTVLTGSFKTNQAGTATAGTITPGTTHTPNAISINCSSTGTQGQATLLIGGGGAGWIQASADL
jgi:hypothetical protein